MNENFEAVIFDMDGVITQTASVHSKVWKLMFDDYLRLREINNNELFIEFTHLNDYLKFVDGKPRFMGVKSFLTSRGISIPYGNPNDSPHTETICGLGNKKNELFNDIINQEGVEVFQSSINFIKELKTKNIRIGVATSSSNCNLILEKAGIMNLFETRVDGIVSRNFSLKGKPEPDIFKKACDNLGVSYIKSVIIEDAVSGVQAGMKGNFGLVIGVARENNENELRKNGADIVVKDLSEIKISTINVWFQKFQYEK